MSHGTKQTYNNIHMHITYISNLAIAVLKPSPNTQASDPASRSSCCLDRSSALNAAPVAAS